MRAGSFLLRWFLTATDWAGGDGEGDDGHWDLRMIFVGMRWHSMLYLAFFGKGENVFLSSEPFVPAEWVDSYMTDPLRC